MNRKKIYTAPSAKVLLFAPCEQLAAEDRGFNSTWGTGYFTFNSSNHTASGVGVQGGDMYSGDDGYTIVRGN